MQNGKPNGSKSRCETIIYGAEAARAIREPNLAVAKNFFPRRSCMLYFQAEKFIHLFNLSVRLGLCGHVCNISNQKKYFEYKK